jgi:hypothetical protein
MMMLYFFDIAEAAETLRDETGTALAGPEIAMIKAAQIAGDLAQPGASACRHVIVRDADGRQIGRVSIVMKRES